MSGEGGQAARGRLYPLLGLFGLAISPRSASHIPIQSYIAKAYKRCLTAAGVNFRFMPSMVGKLAVLERQLVM